jgi:hypothetical protein
MSREIDLDKPLSDEDRAWLKDRSQLDVIAENDRKFKEPGDEEPEVSDDGGQDLKSPADPGKSWEEGTEPPIQFAQRPFDPPVTGAFAGATIVGEEGETEEADDLDEWTVEELKDELRSRDLSTSGNKQELVKRLRDS